jgi:hypothetical protein
MVIPQHIALVDWADQLLVDFPNDNVPTLNDPRAWKDWAAVVVSCPSFRNANAPPPYHFDNWREWAQALFLAVTRPAA